MKKRTSYVCANMLLLLCVLCGSGAAAEQFSFKCEREQAGYLGYFTFDDLRKRVVAYNFLDNHIIGPLSTGDIKKISAEEIQFELVVYYNPNLKLGDYTLNRKEGWMTSSRSHNEDRLPCKPTQLRSVMDLWQLLDSNP